MSDESLDDGSKLLLLRARQLGGGFEKLFHLAGWTGAALLGSVRTHQIFHRNIESFGQTKQLVRAGCDEVAFPVSVRSLSESESTGELLLRKACLLSERV